MWCVRAFVRVHGVCVCVCVCVCVHGVCVCVCVVCAAERAGGSVSLPPGCSQEQLAKEG